MPTLSHANSWQAKPNSPSGNNSGAELQRLQFTSDKVTSNLHVVIFKEQQFDIRVLDDPNGQQASLAAAAATGNWLAGVNGGYFHPDYTPLGLVVADGKVTHQQQQAALLSGIIAANDSRIYLLRPSEFKLGPRTRSALQAGPFLVDQGRPVKGLNSSKRARRTFVATDGQGTWALGTLSPLTLAEAGSLLASDAFARVLPVSRALNLDGGSSSAFYFKFEDGKIENLRALTRVRNYLGIVPR